MAVELAEAEDEVKIASWTADWVDVTSVAEGEALASLLELDVMDSVLGERADSALDEDD